MLRASFGHSGVRFLRAPRIQQACTPMTFISRPVKCFAGSGPSIRRPYAVAAEQTNKGVVGWLDPGYLPVIIELIVSGRILVTPFSKATLRITSTRCTCRGNMIPLAFTSHGRSTSEIWKRAICPYRKPSSHPQPLFLCLRALYLKLCHEQVLQLVKAPMSLHI